MQFYVTIVTLFIVAVAAQDDYEYDGPKSKTGCNCVHFTLCNYTTMEIINDGSSPLGSRAHPGVYEECACPSQVNPSGELCEDTMLVCCHLPQNTETTTELVTGSDESEETDLTWDECGIKGFHLTSAIDRVIASIDKSVTFFTEFRWMALLLKKSDNSMLCGASILHHHVIMTAAHCVHRFQAPDLLVQVGVWNRNGDAESHSIEVDSILKHEEFGPENYRNDIALLVLKQGLVLSPKVAPICLPEPDTTYDNMLCIATGWGIAQYGHRNFSDILKKVELKIVPHVQCRNELRKTRLGPWFRLHDSFVCAKGEDKADTCIGDGGGPLICQQPGSAKYVQVGIVAAGLECGNDIPALYANVPRLMPWIQKKFHEWKLKDLQY